MAQMMIRLRIEMGLSCAWMSLALSKQGETNIAGADTSNDNLGSSPCSDFAHNWTTVPK
jgi:hypothetical protein